MPSTKENAERLEKIYLTKDVAAQRSETIRQLNLCSGERVLDIGCGPGYLCESMGELVGHHGAVVGIDISTDLIALCNRRKPLAWLSYAIGNATEIDQADESFDVVVCTQVAEYIPEVDLVLSEAFRVLKRWPHNFCGNRLGRCCVAFRKSGTHGFGHEIMGDALRPSAPPEVHGVQIDQCRLQV